MIKAIAFDYSGVIAKSFSSDEKMLHVKKHSEKFKEYTDLNNKMDLGEIDENEALIAISKISGIPKDNIWNEIYLSAKLNIELIKLIKKLKSNYKILLFSNYMSYYLNKLLTYYDINNLFDEILISSDYGLLKPDPKYFEILENKAKCQKNEIIFIDDKMENVNGGNEFGIKSFVFTTTDKLIEDLQTEGVKI